MYLLNKLIAKILIIFWTCLIILSIPFNQISFLITKKFPLLFKSHLLIMYHHYSTQLIIHSHILIFIFLDLLIFFLIEGQVVRWVTAHSISVVRVIYINSCHIFQIL